MILYCILGIVVILVFYVISTYNTLTRLKNMVKDQWSQIDVHLKRRSDLIPNLVETVKVYATHENETLESVISARNSFVSAKSAEEEIKANKELTGALSRLMAVVESYPELKVNINFMDLQKKLKETEDKISFVRQFYNDIVLKYKNRLEVFPSNIVASIFGFKKPEFFEASDDDK